MTSSQRREGAAGVLLARVVAVAMGANGCSRPHFRHAMISGGRMFSARRRGP